MRENTNNKSKKKNPNLILAAVLCILLVLIAIVSVILLSYKEAPQTAMEPETVPTTAAPDQTEPQATQPQVVPTTAATEPREGILAATPYGDLYLPQGWEENMFTQVYNEEGSCIVSFCGTVSDKEVELFRLCFGAEQGVLLGYLQSEDGTEQAVSFQMMDISQEEGWSQEEQGKIQAMQEEVNSIIQQVSDFPAFVEDLPEQAAPEELTTHTEYGTFQISVMWEECIYTETIHADEGYCVTFCGDVNDTRVPLYAVHFAELDEDMIYAGDIKREDGTYVSVGIEIFSLEPAPNWTQTEMDKAAAMQEEVNNTMSQLQEWDNFVPAG